MQFNINEKIIREIDGDGLPLANSHRMTRMTDRVCVNLPQSMPYPTNIWRIMRICDRWDGLPGKKRIETYYIYRFLGIHGIYIYIFIYLFIYLSIFTFISLKLISHMI